MLLDEVVDGIEDFFILNFVCICVKYLVFI